jgi:hypothetical protein
MFNKLPQEIKDICFSFTDFNTGVLNRVDIGILIGLYNHKIDTIFNHASLNNVETVEFLIENELDNVDIITLIHIIVEDKISMFKVASVCFEINFIIEMVLTYGYGNIFEYVKKRLSVYDKYTALFISSKNKNVEVSKYIIDNFKILPNRKCLFNAINKGNLDLVRLYISYGCIKLNSGVLDNAILYGQIEVVKFLFKTGIRPSEKIVINAVKSSSLCLLQVLYSLGYEYKNHHMVIAGEMSSISVVSYLHYIGLKFSRELLLNAVEHDNVLLVEFLQDSYAIKYFDEKIFDYAIENDSIETFVYLLYRYNEISTLFVSSKALMKKCIELERNNFISVIQKQTIVPIDVVDIVIDYGTADTLVFLEKSGYIITNNHYDKMFENERYDMIDALSILSDDMLL